MSLYDNELLKFPHKQIRSAVIRRYMDRAGYKRAVCFSCGNASYELAVAGVNVLDISKRGDLVANRWWKPAEIANRFNGYFDATSGHLPLHLMAEIGAEFKKYFGELKDPVYYVPSGSGETVLCLKMAYPDIRFIAVYNLDEATEYNKECPLNGAVEAFCDGVVICRAD